MTSALKKKLLLSLNRPLRPQDVFATSLYTGNGGTQTITNGLDLAGKGGLVWFKKRNTIGEHFLFDTSRGAGAKLETNSTSAEQSFGAAFQNFTASGVTIGNLSSINAAGDAHVLWAWREAKKFFVKLTYTGNGVAGRQIPHGLGDVPGMIVVKARSAARNWFVYHRSLGPNGQGFLNATNAFATASPAWGGVDPTASVFTVGSDAEVNQSGITYVAYLFAHNPDLIDCGSYTGNGSTNGPVVTCGAGWRPQWLLVKNTSNDSWFIYDSARSPTNPRTNQLRPNESSAENQSGQEFNFVASGFQPITANSAVNSLNGKYIYLAIRSPT